MDLVSESSQEAGSAKNNSKVNDKIESDRSHQSIKSDLKVNR